MTASKTRTQPDVSPGPRHVAAIRAALLAWYDAGHRKLPWRTHPSPYGTVVSEFMLQQTQVATVIPYYERFLAEFPDFAALARAPEEQVLRAWSGLGYYRRARMLRRAAQAIVGEHGGRLPTDPAALRALPGFGEYTAGAVGSIALGLRLPIVDGNVRRVVGRLFALEEDLTRGAGKQRLWALCAALVDPRRPGDFNQALMELGATACAPREPRCGACGLSKWCQGRASGAPEQFPRAIRREKTREVWEVAVAVFRQGKVLVLQRGEGASFAGMWELPRLDSREVTDPAQVTPAKVLAEVIGLQQGGKRVTEPTRLGETRSTFTHHRITTELYRVELTGGAIRRQRHIQHRWLSAKNLRELPASRAQRNLFDLCIDNSPQIDD